MTEKAELDQAWASLAESEDPAAIDVLVRQYAFLARYLARRAIAKAPLHQDPDDLVSYAYKGLLDSIRLFEPAVGVKFETYATRRIAGEIMDGQRRDDPLNRGTRRTVKAMKVVIDDHWDRHSRAPSTAEIAIAMGESEDMIRETQLAQQTLNSSLDSAGAADAFSVTGDAQVNSQLIEARERVASRLANLSPQQRAFVLAYYVDHATLRASAQVLKISNLGCRDTRNAVLAAIVA